MGIVKRFLRNLEESRKKQVVFFFICMCLLLVFYFGLSENMNVKKKIQAYSEFDVLYDIALSKEKTTEIDGCVVLLDSFDIQVRNVILIDTTSSKRVVLTTTEKETDMCKSTVNDIQHTAYEFITDINTKKIENNLCYEIFLQIQSKYGKNIFKLFETKRYLFNGQIYEYNPLLFDAPIVGDDNIDCVINNGVLCAYDLEHDCYVYKFQDELYWIINKESELLSKTGKTEMPYHLYTYDNSYLPEDRVVYGYDNLGFFFEDKEYTTENNSNYRVAVINIPQTYPPTYISSGIYDDKQDQWIWNCTFIEPDIIEKIRGY